jgi:hypothetical protein
MSIYVKDNGTTSQYVKYNRGASERGHYPFLQPDPDSKSAAHSTIQRPVYCGKVVDPIDPTEVVIPASAEQALERMLRTPTPIIRKKRREEQIATYNCTLLFSVTN